MIIRISLIRNKKGRSLLMREGRSHSVQSSHCLVFGAKGDRSFILGDRSSETRKGDRS
ncbi:hypothetical protein [Microcoleus sp. herbarium14]|uniref:hypothetical protein n=1 Tax=Microcoleus sp. herbarium14 TaxID=3055439 RepID=UPI002FD12560